ncbi:MAG TPA: MerR family transcriptional regulator [Thermoanaerobaculia bacterium]
MAPKARVQKRLYYKIGEACKELGIQPYVLRYWETEFPALSPSKSRSGQRVYSEKELEIIRRIKVLLYDEGYTIAGAKKKLESEQLGLRNGDAEPDDDAVDEAPPPPALTAVAPPPPAAVVVRRERAAAPQSEPAPALPAAAAPQLDSGAAQTIQTLRTGIQRALQESREILSLLDSKSP